MIRCVTSVSPMYSHVLNRKIEKLEMQSRSRIKGGKRFKKIGAYSEIKNVTG